MCACVCVYLASGRNIITTCYYVLCWHTIPMWWCTANKMHHIDAGFKLGWGGGTNSTTIVGGHGKQAINCALNKVAHTLFSLFCMFLLSLVLCTRFNNNRRAEAHSHTKCFNPILTLYPFAGTHCVVALTRAFTIHKASRKTPPAKTVRSPPFLVFLTPYAVHTKKNIYYI